MFESNGPQATALLAICSLALFLQLSTSPADPIPYIFNPGEWGHPNLKYLERKYNISILKDDPLIIQFNNFLSAAYIDAILHFAQPKFARSTSGVERAVSEYRTSSTAWMTPDVLRNDPQKKIIEKLESEIADIVGLPVENQEHLQVLQYIEDQYYKKHSDFIEEQRNLPCGIRVATFFLYLNDVEEGGGTRFTNLDLTVQPRRGNAILWYSAYPNTTNQDHRTDHEALPVIKGVKYGANKWIHINDFITPWKEGRTT
eukprot:gene3700-6245_t